MRFSAPVIMALAAVANAASAPIEPEKFAKIMDEMLPDTKCDGKTPDCRTATQAAPFIQKSMARYQINSTNEMAAIISLMAFESGNFTYKRNMFPGRPGQGTANMQMANFNFEYAKSIPCLQSKVSNVTTVEGASNATLNYILSLVTVDKYNFGSGPWFYTTKCLPESRDALEKNVDTGFETYMKCVGVSVTEDRKAYLTRAKKAFGLS
ncbi:hypothetical protein MAC_05027 [Metarhizium acridum CQMa 102]|uniref:Uncharacterized protein n=1 Tax=Metarhizium acridum (strain CQMa 102) TaxID=655827 RepID=E9E558_METAQ|nr:uncharacterized protein MAC_05027 [Metarhizium acridum CQMa 102]EFY88933.1 hypothetical protein MAC_05027 [Metarhizium acridum CQMa 102]